MPNLNVGISAPITTVEHTYTSANPYPGVTRVTYPIGVTGSKFRNGRLTPNFNLLRATGKLPENYFSYAETERTHLNGFSYTGSFNTISGNWSVTDKSGVIGNSFQEVNPWSGTLLNLVRANLLNEVKARCARKATDSDIDLSVVAGEFRETAAMFGDLAQRLSKAIRAAKRGDVKAVGSALSVRNSKDWANAWLLANYGIRPFVSDLYGAAKALEKGMRKEGYEVVRSRSNWTDSKTVTTGNLKAGLFVTDWNVKIDAGCRVKYVVTDPVLATLGSLGLLNPLTLLWELKKLSFVVDWGIGIGDWLAQLTAYAGKNLSSASTTVFTRTTGRTVYSRYDRSPNIAGYNVQQTDGSRTFESVACTRQDFAGFPVAYLPAFRDPASLFTVTTSIALLRQSKI